MTWASTPESGEYVGVSRFGFFETWESCRQIYPECTLRHTFCPREVVPSLCGDTSERLCYTVSSARCVVTPQGSCCTNESLNTISAMVTSHVCLSSHESEGSYWNAL